MEKMRIAFFFLFVALTLSACGAGASMPATATPDAYAIQVEQLKAQATLKAPTLAAQATSDERAWTVAQWTATSAAEMTGTAEMWTPTPSQTPTPNMTGTAFVWTPTPNFTGTVAVGKANAQLTAIAGEAEGVVLALRRDRMMNDLKAVTPWVLFVIGFIVALFILYQWAKVRVIHRNANGDAPIILDVFGRVVSDIDKSFHPNMDVRRDVLKSLPPVPLEAQAAVTAKAQDVELQRARNSSGGGQGLSMRSLPLLPAYPLNPATRYRIIPDGAHSQFLNERSIRQMEADWSDNQ